MTIFAKLISCFKKKKCECNPPVAFVWHTRCTSCKGQLSVNQRRQIEEDYKKSPYYKEPSVFDGPMDHPEILYKMWRASEIIKQLDTLERRMDNAFDHLMAKADAERERTGLIPKV